MAPIVEPDETFLVNLASPRNATVADAQAVGTILNDDEVVNQPPVANDDAFVVTEGSGANALDVLANDTDADGDTLTVTAVTQPAAGGSVAIGSGGTAVTFTPAAGFSGEVSFGYTVSDGNGGSDTATVTVTVNPLPTLAIADASVNPDSQVE